jgi:hypothetical protein
MEPDCLSLPPSTCFHALLAATSRLQPLVAWLLPIGPDSNKDITPNVKLEFVNGRNVWYFVVVGGKVPSDSKMVYAGLLLDRVDENEDRFKRFGYFRIIWENEKMVDYIEKRTVILT